MDTVDFKGRYRQDRHQSPFCKKTTVNSAFELLFEGVAQKNSHLVLSYSDTGMIDLNTILALSTKSLPSYETTVLEKNHVHSKMGRSDEKSQDVKEFIILFKKVTNAST